ncbi:DsbA family protein [Pontibacter burrus]|uniref:DsbA family protein n=1 Tax=Pontibacter burrus TaxID=2704466 RepID=A0A6B3M1H6_9BACT|nr:DsbA family protein [Pontibacter burrus]NEM99487.1 DsbA family protein [Pontibacter burrus]
MKKAKLYYVYDALCGWCYGMSPVMQQVYDTYKDTLELEVLSGGMIRGSNVKPISGMANYIRQVAPRLEETTGVELTKAYHEQILDKGTYISNSEPPAIALHILKEQHPDKQIPLAGAIQKTHFVEGNDLNEVEAYLPVAEQFGMSEADFRSRFEDENYKAKALKEFEQVQAWGIQGFPAVVMQKENKLYLIANGYQPFGQLSATIDKILNEEGEL